MAMVFTESYEMRKAYNELTVGDAKYVIDYSIKSPIGSAPEVVSSSFSCTDGENRQRIGYGSYDKGASSVRFDASANIPFEVQSAINDQFMNDLAEILK